MANTMSTDCFWKKMDTILKQFVTSLLLFLTSNITIIVDVRHGTWITTDLSSYAALIIIILYIDNSPQGVFQ